MLINVIYYFTALNVLTLLVYMDDKINARLGGRRTSERTLLMLSAAGGSAGALISIFIGRHKNRKPRFRYGVPVMFFFHAIIVWLIVKYSN